MKDPETGTEQQSREKMAIVTSIESESSDVSALLSIDWILQYVNGDDMNSIII